MNKTALLTLITLVFLTAAAKATRFLSPEGNNAIIDTVYDDDLFITGYNIRFDGRVDGDMYVACNEIVYADTVSGSLHAFSQVIEGLGPVGRSFMGFAYRVSLNAPVGKNVIGFARIIDIGPGAIIGYDANLYGETVTFQGNVGHNLTIGAQNAFISGRIEGDLQFNGGALSISPETVIGGNLIYCSPEKAEIEGRAIIGGETKWTPSERENDESMSAFEIFGWLISHKGYFLSLSLFSLLFLIIMVIPYPGPLAVAVIWIALLISGNLFIMMTKSLSRKTETAIREKTLPSIGLGFAVVFLAPLVILILLLSIFGAPMSAFLILAFGLAGFAGGIYSSLFAGRRLCALLKIGSATSTGYGCYSLGMILLVAISYIPVIGYFVFLIIIMMGIGGLTLALFGKETSRISADAAGQAL